MQLERAYHSELMTFIVMITVITVLYATSGYLKAVILCFKLKGPPAQPFLGSVLLIRDKLSKLKFKLFCIIVLRLCKIEMEQKVNRFVSMCVHRAIVWIVKFEMIWITIQLLMVLILNKSGLFNCFLFWSTYQSKYLQKWWLLIQNPTFNDLQLIAIDLNVGFTILHKFFWNKKFNLNSVKAKSVFISLFLRT